jgi:hypothetical protein
VNKKTRIDDRTGARIELIGGTDLGNGQPATARQAAQQRLTAARLERREPRDEVWVRGIVREVTPPNFKVQGVPVTTSADTEFPGLDAEQFFRLLAPGRVVKVQGTLANNQLIAREVAFETYDDADVGGV